MKKTSKFLQFIVIFLATLVNLSTAGAADVGACYTSSPPLLHARYDWHIFVYFDEPSPYDSLEFFWNKSDTGKDFSHVFVTRRDGTQVHLTTEAIFDSRANEDAYVGDVDHTVDLENGVSDFSANLPGVGKIVAKVRFGQRPTEQYGGLTNPSNHGTTTMVPIMYREKSGLAELVEVSIDGKSQPITQTVFGGTYKAPKVYLTEGWHSVLLYKFRNTSRKEIAPALATSIMGKELLGFELTPDGCSPKTSFKVTPSGSREGDFSFSVDEFKVRIEGKVSKSKLENANVLDFTPTAPDWALNRPFKLVGCEKNGVELFHFYVGHAAQDTLCAE